MEPIENMHEIIVNHIISRIGKPEYDIILRPLLESLPTELIYIYDTARIYGNIILPSNQYDIDGYFIRNDDGCIISRMNHYSSVPIHQFILNKSDTTLGISIIYYTKIMADNYMLSQTLHIIKFEYNCILNLFTVNKYSKIITASDTRESVLQISTPPISSISATNIAELLPVQFERNVHNTNPNPNKKRRKHKQQMVKIDL
jgi:hypothetical protein